MYKIQKKVSQGKILVFFLQDTINFFFQKSGYFLAKSGHYFSIFKIGQGRPPSFLAWRLWWLLLLPDKNSRYYVRCIKQTSPRQLLILVNDIDMREIDLRETQRE